MNDNHIVGVFVFDKHFLIKIDPPS